MQRRAAFIGAFALAAVLVAPAAGPAPVAAQDAPPGAPDISAVAAVVVNLSEADSVIFQRAPAEQRAPASLTKLVTALVARDEYLLEETVVAGPLASRIHGSRLGLELGMQVSVRDLIYGLLLRSGNDAAVALAEHHPAGYRFFMQLMNSKARALGAFDSHFTNPHGLDDPGHYSSARDMALFAREVAIDPVLAAMIATPHHEFAWPAGGTRSFDHHHRLVVEFPWVYGGKTGFTNNAGQCLASVVHTPHGTLVVVVLRSDDHYGDTGALVQHGRAVSAQTALGGGGRVDLYGHLPPPPDPPTEGLAVGLPGGTATDPRDDIRWTVLLGALGVLTAVSLAWRRRSAAPATDVEAWLASLRDRR